MPAVSVILPTRNRHKLLPRALKSLFNQTLQNFEIILIDDNSPDLRLKNDKKLLKIIKDPRVRIFEHGHPRNAASARNFGLFYATGKYITYLDDDDAYAPQKLQRQLELAEETNSPLVICGLRYHLNWRTRRKQIKKSFYTGAELFLKVHTQISVIFHKNEGSPRFNEEIYANDDTYFYFSLIERFNIRRVPNVPEALIEMYPLSGNRVTLNTKAVWNGQRRIYLDFIKKYPRKDSRLFLARLLVSRYRFSSGFWRKLFKHSLRLLKIGGFKEIRYILNTFLSKIPLINRFVIT